MQRQIIKWGVIEESFREQEYLKNAEANAALIGKDSAWGTGKECEDEEGLQTKQGT